MTAAATAAVEAAAVWEGLSAAVSTTTPTAVPGVLEGVAVGITVDGGSTVGVLGEVGAVVDASFIDEVVDALLCFARSVVEPTDGA